MDNRQETETVTEGSVKNGGFYEAKSSSKRKVFKMVFVLLAVVLLSATVALATRTWDPSWNPFRPSPEEILNGAVVEMMKVESMHSEIDLRAKLVTADGSVGTNIKLISDSDGSDDLNSKFRSDFDVTLIDEGMQMFFAGEIIGLGNVFYVKADTIPLPITAGAMMMGIDLEQWRGRWIAIDPEDTGMSFTPDPEKTDELERKTTELFKKYPLLVSERQFSDKVIDGNKTYHYLFKLDRDNAQSFLIEMIEFQSEMEFNEEDMDEVMELIDMVADASIEIYIDKKKLLIRKVVVKDVFEINDDEIGPDGELDIDLEMKFSGFGEPVDIVVPEDSSSIMEIFGSLITGSGLPSARERAMDSRIKSALDQVKVVAEIIYSRDGNYDNLCVSDTSLDITDTINGLNVFQSEILGNGGSIACYSSGNDYCLSSSLNSPGEFWCIDSNGSSKATDSSCVGASDGCR